MSTSSGVVRGAPGACTLVGVPLSELTGRCVALETVFGATATGSSARWRGPPPADFVIRLIPQGGIVGDRSE